MKVTAEPTDVITHVNERPARVWIATTENGVQFFMMVSLCAVDGTADVSEFERALNEIPPPREVLSMADVLSRGIDLRLVH